MMSRISNTSTRTRESRDNDEHDNTYNPRINKAQQQQDEDDEEDEVYEDAPINQGLLSRKRKTINNYYKHDATTNKNEWMRPYWLGVGLFLILFAFWLLDSLKDPIFVKLVDGKLSLHQPYAKLCSVITTLLIVCLLEYGTNLKQKWNRQQEIDIDNEIVPSNEILDPVGGIWKRIQMKSASLAGGRRCTTTTTTAFSSSQSKGGGRDQQENSNSNAMDDIASIDIFYYIGIPYLIMFSIISYCVWRFEQRQTTIISIQPSSSSSGLLLLSSYSTVSGSSTNNYYTTTNTNTSNNNQNQNEQQQHENEHDEENPWGYYILGYILYATVESFGSLAVATFWSYTNSTLSLQDAERYYGPILATAQLGAIGGSTLVATGRWEASYLLIVVALSIILQLLIMHGYDRRFEPTNVLVVEQQQHHNNNNNKNYPEDDTRSVLTWQDNNATITKPFWSGLYLIFQHSYVLLILGVSCLYEVSMTLLDYQMKLLGFARFNDDDANVVVGGGVNVNNSNNNNNNKNNIDDMSFTEFMGHYGQVVNITSLIFSSLLFPFLIRRVGLRKTLLLFPTMLLIVTFLAYGALPGNLTVLFVSLSLLKAMTYSVHDPSKEMLYIPTSNAVKLRAKFWIDVVGERITKAIGSGFNTFAKNIEQSVRIGSVPSLLSALGLWSVCYYVGLRFDKLLATGKIVGLEHSIDPSTYKRVPTRGEEEERDYIDNNNDDDDDDPRNYDYRDEPSEVELRYFEEDNVSTLDLMADPVRDALEGTTTVNNNNNNETSSSSSSSSRREIVSGIELPPFSRIR